MSTRLRTLFALSALASFGLLAPGRAMAGPAPSGSAFFTIDDAGLTSGNPNNIFASLAAGAYITPTSSGIVSGNFSPGPIVIGNESVSTLGSVDHTFVYWDPTPPTVSPTTMNFNIFEPNGGPLSDTLSMTFTAVPSGAITLTQVILHFLSDNDVLPISQLAGANTFNITETGAYQDLTSQVASTTGLQAFHIRFASDVEPVPLPSAVSGAALLAGLGAVRVVRRRPKSSISHP